MKLLLIGIGFSVIGFGQTEQVCYVKTPVSGSVTQVCIIITPAMKSSLTQFIVDQVIPQVDGNGKQLTDANGVGLTAPKYLGPANLVFSYLKDGLFAPLLLKYPPANLKTKLTVATTANTDVQNTANAIVPTLPTTEP